MILNISFSFKQELKHHKHLLNFWIYWIYWIFVACINQKEQKKLNTGLNKYVIIQIFLVMKIDYFSLT